MAVIKDKADKKISDIREEFMNIFQKEGMAAEVDALPVFVETYKADARSGVQALVAKAKKAIDTIKQEQTRMETMKVYEKKYASYEYICGIDEAGRGPLAGPVVAGAVILTKYCQILYLNESKQLSYKNREEL